VRVKPLFEKRGWNISPDTSNGGGVAQRNDCRLDSYLDVWQERRALGNLLFLPSARKDLYLSSEVVFERPDEQPRMSGRRSQAGSVEEIQRTH
jgi:hypothetical protein